MTARLTVRVERFKIAGSFTIARGSRTESVVVVAEIAGSRVVKGRDESTGLAEMKIAE